MTQTSFLPKSKRDHGGSLALHRRRSRRNLDIRKPVHIVLRSELAKKQRSLLRNRILVEKVLRHYSRRFGVKIYEKAICGNHIHLLVKAYARRDLQNFFRVVAGQIAQEILRKYPMQEFEEKAFWGGTPKGFERGAKSQRKKREMHRKNQRTFWSLLLYTRIVSWGRDFGNVGRYLVLNTKEALGIVPFQPRRSRFIASSA